MNKKVLNQLEKTIITVITILVLTAVLFVFTSCKSSYQKAIEGGTDTIVSESTTDTTADTGTNTTNQTTTSENEPSTQTTVSGTETTAATETTNPQNQQIIEVTAKRGGYSPRKIDAKAGVPTILIMKSEGAYGCERAFYIPDLKIGELLPENGQTKFDLGTQAKGTKLVGVCGMGMYYFQISFN